MATPLFNWLSQDNPFDPSDRQLWKRPRRTGAERRKDREHRRETGEKPKEREAREARENREAKEKAERAEKQAELFGKMTDKLTAQKDKIGDLNHDKVLERLKSNRDSGELTEDQLSNLDDALTELAAIHEKQGELTSDDYGELIRAFNMKHIDIIMTPEEAAVLRKMVDERLDYYDGQEAKIDEAHETRNLSELEELALAFVTDAKGDNPEVGGTRLSPGTEYNVDFHDDTGKLNYFAHNNVTLGHIMSGTGLLKVDVEKKSGWKGTAYLHPNGKAYTNAPWESTRGNYVGIVSGDKFSVLEDSYRDKPETIDVEDQLVSAKRAEAALEESNFEIHERHIDRVTLDEAERELKRGMHADIPDDVKRLKGADLEEKLITLDMGDYVVQLCEEFAGLPNSVAQGKTGTRLFIDIMEHGGRGRITLNEITKAVLGEGAGKFVERYEENKLEAETLRWTEHFMAQEKLDNPDMTAREFRDKCYNAMGSDQEKIVINKYTGDLMDMFESYEVGSDSKSARTDRLKGLFAKRKQNTEFMLRAHRLLQAVPQMKNREYAATTVDRGLEKSAELQSAESVLDQVFPPDETPRVKQGLLSSVFRRHGKEATMGNVGERVTYTDAKEYEQMFTGLYANQYIREKIVRIEKDEATGEFIEVVDLDALASLFNELQEQGRLIAAQNAEESRQEGHRAMVAPGTEFTAENVLDIKNWGPGTADLIQYGMQVEQMKEYSALKEQVIDSYPDDIAEAMRTMEMKYDFTPEELQEIGDNIKMAQSTLFHLTYTETRHLNNQGEIPKQSKDGRPVNPKELNFGATQSFTVFEGPDGGKITMNMGFNVTREGDAVKPNSFDTSYGFHLGPSYSKSFGADERNSVSLSAGVSGIPSEATWRGGASLTISHNWGEYQTWASGITGSVGTELGTGVPLIETLALVHAGVTLVDINHNNVITKRADMSFEEQKAFIKDQMEMVDDAFERDIDNLDGMNPTQLAEFKQQLLTYYKRQLVYNEIDDMSTVQFDKLGVEVIAAPPYILPRIGVAIKGKTQTIYAKSSHFDTTELADRELAKKGGDNYQLFDVSGDLMFNEEGEVTYERAPDQAYNLYKNLEAAQEYYLTEFGLQIERVGDSDHFRLVPVQADGIVEVYGDAGEGITVKPSKKGEVLFSIPELTDLAIQKHVHVTPLRDGGVQEVTRIYLTDNPSKNPDMVRRSHAYHMEAYVSHRDSGRNSVFEDVRHIGDNEVISNGEAGPENWEDADVLEAQAKVDAAFGNPEKAGIGMGRYKEIQEAVIAAAPRIDAKFRGSEEAYRRAILHASEGIAADLGITTGAERTALIQLVLIEDRSNAPLGKEFIDHIVTWNLPSVAESLKDNGIDDPALANTFASKICTGYANKMLIAYKQNGSDHLPATTVEMSAFVQTHIGRLPDGNVMEFMNGATDPEAVTIEGALSIHADILAAQFDLELGEAEAIVKAFTEQMAPLDLTNTDQMLQHPIALQLLQNAAVIFGPEMATALAAKDATALEEFRKVMEGLTAEPGAGLKTFEYKGRELKVIVDMKMGFLYKCRNFTTTYSARMPEMMAGAEARTLDSVDGRAAARLYGAGMVGGASVKEVPHGKEPVQNERHVGGNGEEEAGGEEGEQGGEGGNTGDGRGSEGQGQGNSQNTGDSDLDK